MSAGVITNNRFRMFNRGLKKYNEYIKHFESGEEFKKTFTSAMADDRITTEEAYAIADAVNRDRLGAGKPLLSEEEYKAVAAAYRTSEYYFQISQARQDGIVTEEEAITIAHAHNSDLQFEGQDVLSDDELMEIASYWKD